MVADWKCEEDNPEITGSQSWLETDGNTMKQPYVLAVPDNVQKRPWGHCLGVCSSFSFQPAAVLDGRQNNREEIQESF